MSANIPERLFVVAGLTTLRPRFLAAWKVANELIKAGHPIEVIVRLRKSKRSIEQNKRLWAMLREISATVWIEGKQYSDEVWHEQFKRWFIGMVEMPDGSTVGTSTTTLNVGEFGDYMTRIEQWCAEGVSDYAGHTMIRRACTSVWYCDTCEAKWSYGGATNDICDDKAKRDGWVIETAHPLGIPVIRHVCPPCVRARR